VLSPLSLEVVSGQWSIGGWPVRAVVGGPMSLSGYRGVRLCGYRGSLFQNLGAYLIKAANQLNGVK